MTGTGCAGGVRAGGALVLYARQWLPDAASAEDAVQEAMTAVLAQARPPDDPVAWMFRAVRNAAIDQARATSGRRRRGAGGRRGRGASGSSRGPTRLLDAQAAERALAAASRRMSARSSSCGSGAAWGSRKSARVTGLGVSTVHDRYTAALEQSAPRTGEAMPDDHDADEPRGLNPAQREVEGALRSLAPAAARVDPVAAAFDAGRRSDPPAGATVAVGGRGAVAARGGELAGPERPPGCRRDASAVPRRVDPGHPDAAANARSPVQPLPDESLLMLEQVVHDKGVGGLPAPAAPLPAVPRQVQRRDELCSDSFASQKTEVNDETHRADCGTAARILRPRFRADAPVRPRRPPARGPEVRTFELTPVRAAAAGDEVPTALRRPGPAPPGRRGAPLPGDRATARGRAPRARPNGP